MKNVLLATDLGPNSDRAMERALKVAKEQKSELHIVHVAPTYTGPKSKKWAFDLQKHTEDLIRGYLQDYKDASNVKTNIIIKQGGESFFEILEAAYANKVDLIIMGMHGKKKLRDLFVGTTIERVIRKGIKPVLMVKKKPIGPYQSIMSAIDFAPGSRAALRVGMEVAPQAVFFAAHVYNVPVYYPGAGVYVETQVQTEKAQHKMLDAFLITERGYFAKTHNVTEKRLSGSLLEGPVTDTLVKKAKNLKADLITIGTHSQPGFMPRLGGTAGDILSNPPCDVLVASEKFHD